MPKRPRMSDDNSPLKKTGAVLNALVGPSSESDNLKTQQLENSTTQEGTEGTGLSGHETFNNSTTQQSKLPGSEAVQKPKIRRATFGLDERLLKRLDRFYLSLKLDVMDGEPPYKEVIVEEAIARLLDLGESDRDALLIALQDRQSERR